MTGGSPPLVVVSGIPGAGKTTVARSLAQRFPAGVHLEADALQRLIASGSVWPDGEPREEARRQLRLRGTHVALLADSFVEHGFAVVVDDVVIGTRVDELAADVRTRPLRLVQLVPRADVVSERDRDRPHKHVFHKWGRLDTVLRSETPKVGLWLDSSELTAEQTVEEILRRWDEAVL